MLIWEGSLVSVFHLEKDKLLHNARDTWPFLWDVCLGGRDIFCVEKHCIGTEFFKCNFISLMFSLLFVSLSAAASSDQQSVVFC